MGTRVRPYTSKGLYYAGDINFQVLQGQTGKERRCFRCQAKFANIFGSNAVPKSTND